MVSITEASVLSYWSRFDGLPEVNANSLPSPVPVSSAAEAATLPSTSTRIGSCAVSTLPSLWLACSQALWM